MTTLAGRRVAIYARFSTDLQNPASVDDQHARCRRWVEERGGNVSPALTFADRGISAASMDRPGWVALERQIGAGAVDVIVVESPDRISRKSGDTLQLMERLKFARVTLYTIADGFDSTAKSAKMHMGMRALMSDMYIDDLADKVRRGMEGRARSGHALGGLPYGYHAGVAPTEHAGRPILIVPEEAAVVRRLFAMWLGGASSQTIARELNSESVKPPRSSRRDRGHVASWQHTTIRSMLANERYAGRWVWNRRIWTKAPGTNRRVCSERPPHEWIRSDRPDLAIVSEEDFARAHARTAGEARALGVLTSAERRGTGRRSYLLSGLLRCACGALMAIHGGGTSTRRYYRCSEASSRGMCPQRAVLREDLARSMWVAEARTQLADPAKLAEIRDVIASVLDEESGNAGAELAQHRAKLAKVETMIGRVVDAIADSAGSDALRVKLRALEEEQRQERAAIRQLEQCAIGADDLPTVDELVASALDLGRLLDGADVPAAREALRSYLTGGRITARVEAGSWVLDAGLVPPLMGSTRSDHPIAEAGFVGIRARVVVPLFRRSA